MLVSVLIDNYNYNKFLRECIESILNQTYQNFEIVIVDDGSSDNSKEIIKEYAKKDKRIKPIFKKNGGQASAFNEGIKHCNGKTISFLDSDDLFKKNKLEEIVKIYNKGYEYIINDYELLGDKNYKNAPYYPYGGYNLFLVYYLNFFAGSTTSNITISNRLAQKIFPIANEDFFRIRADDVIVLKASMLSEMIFLDKELTLYRIHGSNLFASNYKQISNSIQYERDRNINIIKKEVLDSENIADIFFKNPFHLFLEFKTKQVYDTLILKKYLKLLFFEMQISTFKKLDIGLKMVRYYLSQKSRFKPKKRVHL